MKRVSLRERNDIALRSEAAQTLLRRSEEELEADLQREREQTERLRQALAAARSRELARIAINQQNIDPGRALLIALEAATVHPGLAAEDALRRILLTHTERAVLRGHEREVCSAQFSPDSQRIVTASEDKTARVWDAATGQELVVLRGHDGRVRSAQFSPDGRYIVTASWDGTARVWDTATGRELAVLRGHEGMVDSAQFLPDVSGVSSLRVTTSACGCGGKNGPSYTGMSAR